MTGLPATERRIPVYHVITPGDHFSARTGSAIPTVVHGLATGAALVGDAIRYPQWVVLQKGTYEPRYPSAEPLTYAGAPAPGDRRRLMDAALGRLGMPRGGAAAYFRPVADVLQGTPSGIVLAHNAPIVPWLLRSQRHDVVLYAHNDLLRSFSRRESGRMLAGTAAVVCVSESLASQMKDHLPAELHDRVRVVVNGVDTAQFSPATSPARDAGPLRIMFMGRAIAEKGADTLLEAAALLGRADLQFTVVGSYGFDAEATLSPFEQRLRELAGRVPGGVQFQPFVDRLRLPELLRRADILTVPSRWLEPCGLTVGEGMATGLPVVASRIGGIPEVLGDAGILVEPGDAAGLAAALEKLADDAGLRAERGAAALARARERDWRWAWGELAEVLDEVASDDGGRTR